jgi:hypothetical protein
VLAFGLAITVPIPLREHDAHHVEAKVPSRWRLLVEVEERRTDDARALAPVHRLEWVS